MFFVAELNRVRKLKTQQKLVLRATVILIVILSLEEMCQYLQKVIYTFQIFATEILNCRCEIPRSLYYVIVPLVLVRLIKNFDYQSVLNTDE